MLTSEQLKKIVTETRPLIEQQLDLTEQVAGLREVVTAAGGDWSQLKALVKAQIQDERDDASSEAQVRADRSEWPDRQNEPDHSPDAGKMVNEPATAPPTVGGPVEGVAPPASSATNFPVTVEGSSSTGGTDVGGDGEAHSMPDKSGEGDAPSPSPAPGNGEPTNVVALPVRKPSDRPFSSSGLERPYGCLHVDACPKTWRDTEPCSMCRAAIAVEAGGTAVRHQGSIGQ